MSGATVPTAAPTTTTTNPYAIPPVIDAAYVNRVLAGLDTQFGDVLRLMMTNRSVPPEGIDRLKALYADTNVLNLQLQVLQDGLRSNFAGYANPVGNRRTAVIDLLTGHAQCIYARVTRDYSAVVSRSDGTVNQEWVALRPLDAAQDPIGYNPTKWALIYDGAERNSSAPRSPPCIAAS